jgi:hypothetical protein
MMPTLIRDYSTIRFAPFIDNYIRAATSFKEMFRFLHKKYFLRITFSPLSLLPLKSHFFFSLINVIGFLASLTGLRLLARHRNRIVL